MCTCGLKCHRGAYVNSMQFTCVLCGVFGQCRFDSTAKSDAEVRAMFYLPSIDCILDRKRLSYLPTLLTSAPRNLRALLSVRLGPPKYVPGRRLPWVDLISSDLGIFKVSRGNKLDDLGDPRINSDRWHAFILAFLEELKMLVDGLHFSASTLDCQPSSKRCHCQSVIEHAPLHKCIYG